MRKSTPKTRVSQHFRLDRDQITLDFVDVPIGNDMPVFLDPSRFRAMNSTWASECTSLLQHFFESLLKQIKNKNKAAGIALLSQLTEKNEFHLGLSKGKSDGRAFGPGYKEKIWDALTKSKAGTSGLLKDLEDTCLFIEGIGPDRISDAVCNILRGPLIKYTQDICNYYGIPLTKNVDSGPIWNPQSEAWEDDFVSLPITPFGKLLLVPKIAVRHKLAYDYGTYYTHYLLPAMQLSEKQANSALVITLKDGRKKVTKKSLRDKYGANKLAITDQTLRHTDSLDEYKKSTQRQSRPLTLQQFSEIAEINQPDYAKLLSDVEVLKPGQDDATAYENAIEKLLSALFFPSLMYPTKQNPIHNGRKRIDITYVNDPKKGFFHWLSQHYPSSHIHIECKNYGKEIGNPELDQLAGRFSPSRGQVGLLICRSISDEKKLSESCKDTAKDGRGYIITLTDDELKLIVQDHIQNDEEPIYPYLRKKFNALVM